AQARVLRCGLDDACSLPTLHPREASRRASVVTSMRSRRRLKQLLIGTLRGTVVALSLLGYLAASIGFPAPALTAERTAQSEEPSSACSGGACGWGAEPGHCCCCSGKTKLTPPPPPPAPPPATPPSHCNKGGDSETACPLCEARALLFVNPDEASELLGDEPCPFCAKAEDPAPCCDEPKPTEPAKPEINNPPPRDESSGDVSIRWVQGVQARHCHA